VKPRSRHRRRSAARLRRAAAAALLALLGAGSGRAGDDAAPIAALAFARDGATLAAGSQDGVVARPWPALEPARRLETGIRRVHDLAFSPDGGLLAIAGGRPGVEGAIELRRWPGGELAARAAPHRDLVYAAAFSPDGRRIACAGHDHAASVLETAALEPRLRLEGHSRPVLAIAWLDGQHLASAGIDASLRLWDAESGTAGRAFENHTAPVRALALRPGAADGSPPVIASAGDDGTLRLWQPSIGRLMRFTRLASPPLALAWTPDGRRIAAACRDGRLRLVDPDTIAVVAERPAVGGWAQSLAIHPGGAAAAVGGERGAIAIVSLSEERKEDS
jgi:WD40 repeat protein